MPAKKGISARQIDQFQKLVGDDLKSFNPPADAVQRVLGPRVKEFKAGWRRLVIELMGVFYILVTDEEAVAWIVKQAKKSKAEARQIVNGWRMKARAADVADTVLIHAVVLQDCLFKRDIPKMGPCWEDFGYLQDWNFPDQPTEHALVSWVPVPLANSTRKNVQKQAEVVGSFKTEAGLPAWYEVSFGSLNHLGGLALAHFKATNKDPFNGLVVRTDICRADGGRLSLVWDEGRLSCGYWYWGDGDRDGNLAVFALGVIKALGR